MANLSSPQPAAVLVLHDLSEDSLILTQRSWQLRDHPSAICFPGGRWQEGDGTLLITALRELNEELAITPERVLNPCSMQPVNTLTGFIIHPWFATISTLIPCWPNQEEVKEVFSVPMQQVRNAGNYKQLEVKRHNLMFKTWQFIADARMIWGATAKIMMQLCR